MVMFARLDRSRLDRSSKCVLLWKPSVFAVFPVVRSQSKTKIVLQTVFETFTNSTCRYKTQKVSGWVLWVGIFTRAFY